MALTAFAVVAPTIFLGNASGHDFEFHLNSWMEVLHQWKDGIMYPRWAAFAHYEYGSARFIFYPPASWMLGGFLGAVLPWAMVPGAYIGIALTAAGLSMFCLARRWLSRRDAVFASALYAANPYHVVIVYWRSAFAELLASALLPLLLLFVLRAEAERRRVILPLALIVAAAWLTNIPSAVLVNYSLALLLVVVAIVRRSPRVLLYGAAAVVVGAALAAFYLLPAAYEAKWVNIAQVLAPGVRPQGNFLFTIINDRDHNMFNRLVSIGAVMEIVVLVAAAILSRNSRRHRPDLWWTLAAWATAATLLMFSITSVFWEYLPKLRFVQLPWRWLLCLNVALSLFVTIGMRHFLSRLLVCFAMLAVVALLWHRVQPPWWDNAADIAELQDNIDEDRGYEGTEEYVPAGADPYEIKQDARKVAVEGGGTVRIHVQQWGAESRFFTADVTEPARLILRLFNYPAWRVKVNGRVVSVQTQPVTGQMIIAIEPGENRVHIVFTRTWDRTAGGVISGVSLVSVVVWLVVERKRRHLSLASS